MSDTQPESIESVRGKLPKLDFNLYLELLAITRDDVRKFATQKGFSYNQAVHALLGSILESMIVNRDSLAHFMSRFKYPSTVRRAVLEEDGVLNALSALCDRVLQHKHALLTEGVG